MSVRDQPPINPSLRASFLRGFLHISALQPAPSDVEGAAGGTRHRDPLQGQSLPGHSLQGGVGLALQLRGVLSEMSWTRGVLDQVPRDNR